MNCKQGDLAIVVRSRIPNSPNIGKIVRCLEFVPTNSIGSFGLKRLYDSWRVDTLILTVDDKGRPLGYSNMVSDCYLLPLRDDEGQDETITWAGKPEGVKL